MTAPPIPIRRLPWLHLDLEHHERCAACGWSLDAANVAGFDRHGLRWCPGCALEADYRRAA